MYNQKVIFFIWGLTWNFIYRRHDTLFLFSCFADFLLFKNYGNFYVETHAMEEKSKNRIHILTVGMFFMFQFEFLLLMRRNFLTIEIATKRKLKLNFPLRSTEWFPLFNKFSNEWPSKKGKKFLESAYNFQFEFLIDYPTIVLANRLETIQWNLTFFNPNHKINLKSDFSANPSIENWFN